MSIGAILESWSGVIIPVVVAFGILGLLILVNNKLSKAFSSFGSHVGTVANFLKSYEAILLVVFGNKYEPIYDALLASLSAISDGKITEEEAVKLSKETFDAVIKLKQVKLTAKQSETANALLEAAVKMIVKEPPKVAAKALSMISRP